jgi:membrane protein implicated in regulation of membrane protease activity
MGMAGKSITHRWIYNGENKGEVQFQIGGDRWRVYSSKTLVPEWTGTWTVDVVDGDGNKLYTGTLDYQAAP